MPNYRDWLKAEQANINPAGTPAIVRPSETVGAGYAALTMMNDKIRNTPETARGGYSALAPAETVSATAPRMASAAPATIPATGTAPSFANLDDASKARMKQNNPALYNQLLVQGIIKPIAEVEKTATAPATVTAPVETVEPKTDAGSPSTGETEPTGYAKYLADHPEFAEAGRRAEAEYARSLPTYGALAERMAQAGIHGGYSDYLQGVAYAQMQNAKQQTEEAARAGYAALTGNGGAVMTDNAKALYQNLLSEYGDQIAGITDETQYAQFEDLFRSANKGLYSEADINSALRQAREYRQTSLNNAKANTQDLVKQYGAGEKTSDDILAAYGISIVQGIDKNGNEMKDGESDEDYEKRKQEAVRWVLSQAVKDDLIDDKKLSATVKNKLAIYDADFGNKSWKSAGEDIYNSVSTAIDDKEGGVLSGADLQTVLNDAISAMGVSSISLDYIGGGSEIHPDLKLTLKDGTKLKADYNGRATDTVSEELTRKYGNLPLVVYDKQLYYQYPTDDGRGNLTYTWYKLKTKTGSPGTTKQGDMYFATVAKIMMYNNNAEKMEKAGDVNNRYRTWDIKTGKLTYSK